MSFDPNFLLPDQALTEYHPFDSAAFLKRLDSPLLQVVTPEGPAVQLLDQVAREADLDPRVLLAKLQVEQSLVTQPATPERLDWALGYGVPDQGPSEERFRGFARQLRAAARTLKAYLEPGHSLSVVDLVGKPMTVSDGTVRPANLASAALYRYTPWRGDRDTGDHKAPFGNALFAAVWTEFFGPLSQEKAPEGWRVIAPPDRWRNPLAVSDETAVALQALARRLELRMTVDSERRKLYLGLPELSEPPPRPSPTAGTLTYPSGYQAALAPPLSASEAERYRPAGTGPPAPLVVVQPDAQLSAHFRLREFLPHDPSYRYARVAPALVELLEALRRELGVPLTINSGYRPPAYNSSIGGASQSVHMDGLAADVSANVPLARLAAAAERLVGDRGGLGVYPEGFVHVDLRGSWARW